MDDRKNARGGHHRFKSVSFSQRSLTILVFAAVALAGVIGTVMAYRAERAVSQAKFEMEARSLIERLRLHVEQQLTILSSTTAFAVAAGDQLDAPRFRAYWDSQRLGGTYAAARLVGYAPVVAKGREKAVVDAIAKGYGVSRDIWPPTDQTTLVPVALLEPQDEANRAGLAYDMFSELTRREAIIRAMQDRRLAVTAPLELPPQPGADRQKTVLAYLPVPAPDGEASVRAVTYAVFGVGDLHRSALADGDPIPMEVQTRDTTSELDSLLYQSPGFVGDGSTSSFQSSGVIQVGGREWSVTVRPGPGYKIAMPVFTYSLAFIFVILAAAAAAANVWRMRAISAADEVQSVLEKAADDKELLAQEMKHRMKNSIARIVAIARQTGLSSSTIAEFNKSFSARLQAMASAQDMQMRQQGRQTDLYELLRMELLQVFGPGLGKTQLHGPDVTLEQQMAQALGLTFHELATNSLKYGAAGRADGEVSVRWRIVEDQETGDQLEMEWREVRTLMPFTTSKRGFGTRLIDINIGSELGGTIDRIATPSGLAIRIRLPLPARA